MTRCELDAVLQAIPRFRTVQAIADHVGTSHSTAWRKLHRADVAGLARPTGTGAWVLTDAGRERLRGTDENRIPVLGSPSEQACDTPSDRSAFVDEAMRDMIRTMDMRGFMSTDADMAAYELVSDRERSGHSPKFGEDWRYSRRRVRYNIEHRERLFTLERDQ